MKLQMRFEGGQELAKALSQLPMRASKKILLDALKEGGEPIRSSASRFAPREPGAPDLADNISISTARTDQPAAVAIGPTKGFFYGLFQEYGTVHHGAQPFMRPAFDGETPKALGIIGQALWRELAGRGIGRSASISAGLSESVASGGRPGVKR